MQSKVVIVTGGGRGIGRAVCERFATDGAAVIAAARSDDQLAETKQAVEDRGGRCDAVVTDIASRADVQALIDSTRDRYGRLDVLVNNAGVAPNGPMDAFDLDVFDTLIAVNVAGPFYASRLAWPLLAEGDGGVIVNISSMASVDPFPGFAAYGASKAFINGLTRGLADEGKKCGIRVYAVGPGAVDTAMLRGPFPDFPGDQCLQPTDVAETVWLVTQPGCRYAAGQTVYLVR